MAVISPYVGRKGGRSKTGYVGRKGGCRAKNRNGAGADFSPRVKLGRRVWGTVAGDAEEREHKSCGGGDLLCKQREVCGGGDLLCTRSLREVCGGVVQFRDRRSKTGYVGRKGETRRAENRNGAGADFSPRPRRGDRGRSSASYQSELCLM